MVCIGFGQPPEGWPKDLPHPEPLAPSHIKEADDISELLGDYVAACLYSRIWQLREAALLQLSKYLEDEVMFFRGFQVVSTPTPSFQFQIHVPEPSFCRVYRCFFFWNSVSIISRKCHRYSLVCQQSLAL